MYNKELIKVSRDDFKNNFDHYIKLLNDDLTILIYKNETAIAKIISMTSPIDKFSGILEEKIDNSYSNDDLINDRISKYQEN